jgi:hypothetical protein
MTSPLKRAASRLNGQKSRGPQTRAGRRRASRNAWRHGLAAATQPGRTEIEQTALALCSGDKDPVLFEKALAIAECEFLLRSIRLQCVAVVERLRDGNAIALAKGDNSIALAKARSREARLAWEEIFKIKARFGVTEPGIPIWIEGLEDRPPDPGWRPPPPKIRDEVEALSAALPDLNRLERYAKRAWARRKRSFREFLEIKSRGDGQVVDLNLPSNAAIARLRSR